jgi:DNA-binding CsgD family transcriptional regulator
MLVGRAPELAALGVRLERGQPLALVGEAGIGKTALLRAASAASGRRTFEGGGLASLSYLSYLPLARAVGENPPSGEADAVADWVAARVDGGLLVLDDLHWADSETLALLPTLAGRVALLGAIRRGDPRTREALRGCKAAGADLLDVGPLDETAATLLVLAASPELSPARAAAVVAAGAGNALLLEELARGEDAEALRLGLGARLLRCSEAAQTAMATLGLLGRPAEPALVGPGVAELVDAGLALVDGLVRPRHALIGELAAGRLTSQERRRLHGMLARTLDDPAESSRHHLAAGDRAAAHRRARQAAADAASPGERARHLALAASTASGPRAAHLRLEAAEALVDVGDCEAAEALVAGIDGADDDPRAWLVRARARYGSGESSRARHAAEAGLTACADSTSDTAVRLEIELARLAGWDNLEWEAVAHAREALRLARQSGVERPRSHSVLGIALKDVGDAECFVHLRAGFRGARRAGDRELELETGAQLVNALEEFKRPSEAHALAVRLQRRAAALGLDAWAPVCAWICARIALHTDGPTAELLAHIQELRTHALARGYFENHVVLGLADLGHFEAASRRLERAEAADASAYSRSALLAARAELHWLEGRCRDAVCVAEVLLAEERAAHARLDAVLVHAWSLVDLGKTPPPAPEVHLCPMYEGGRTEVAALGALARGAAGEAEALFDDAAAGWRGSVLRGELRCAWAAGEAARRAGDLERARARLIDVEARLESHGLVPLLARARRSLRAAGVRRSSARRPGTATVTAREREILQLVAAGLASAEIARRLGVSRPTVESHVESAKRKLGARTRRQAAAQAEAV